ncbi:MAG: hypothetical protein WCK25_05095, partial [Actinomycetes bacterium]
MAVPAPHEITAQSLNDARSRFDRFRLQIWQSTSEQRGHPLRMKVMGLAPVGSRRFALLSRVGSTTLHAARKIGFDRKPLELVAPEAFPKGFDPSASLEANASPIPVFHIEDPDNPAS